MKGHINQLKPTADVTQIECDLYDAELSICTADDGQLTVIFPDAKNVKAASNENLLLVNQTKRPVLCAKQRIIIQVPQHLVPDVNIRAKRSDVRFDGGIYGALNLKTYEGEFNALNCVFNEVAVISGNVYVKDATVKSTLSLQAEKGDLLSENVFASHAEFKVKRGNTGLINFSGKECVLDALKGNVTATFSGDKQDYSVSVKTVSGTTNTESFSNENADKSVKVYAKGNVMLDFIGVKEQVTEAAVTTDGGDGETKE